MSSADGARTVVATSSRAPFGRLMRLTGTRPRRAGFCEIPVSEYSLYLVECADGSLYTGITTDVDRRFEEHNAGQKGAKFLRGKGPLKLVFRQSIGDRGLALRVEARVRKLPRKRKADLDQLPALIRQEIAAITDHQ